MEDAINTPEGLKKALLDTIHRTRGLMTWLEEKASRSKPDVAEALLDAVEQLGRIVSR